MRLNKIVLLTGLLLASQVQAVPSMVTSGVVVMVPVTGVVTHANEEVVASFEATVRSKDKAEATSEVSRLMKAGLAILRAKDGSAKLQTSAFHFYPQYKRDKNGRMEGDSEGQSGIIGWEVSQLVTATTQDLAGLPKTVAALQGTLDLSNLRFGVTAATTAKLDDQRTAATYQRLNERIASIARAMGKDIGDATLESISIDGASEQERYNYQRVEVTGSRIRKEDTAEPVFEAGETKLTMSIVGKVRFK